LVRIRTGIFSKGAVVAIAAFVLNGCGGLTPLYRQHSAWEGHTLDQLVESWGEPDSRTDLGQGVEAYTWTGVSDGCQVTFTVQVDEIVGVSDTGCSS
jgi:hypothetical protein